MLRLPPSFGATFRLLTEIRDGQVNILFFQSVSLSLPSDTLNDFIIHFYIQAGNLSILKEYFLVMFCFCMGGGLFIICFMFLWFFFLIMRVSEMVKNLLVNPNVYLL